MPLAPPTELLFHFSKFLDNLLLTSDNASLSCKPLVFTTHSYLHLEIKARKKTNRTRYKNVRRDNITQGKKHTSREKKTTCTCKKKGYSSFWLSSMELCIRFFARLICDIFALKRNETENEKTTKKGVCTTRTTNFARSARMLSTPL